MLLKTQAVQQKFQYKKNQAGQLYTRAMKTSAKPSQK